MSTQLIYLKKYYSIFTLIELLIVISVIAILLTLLLPALKEAKFKAKRAVCTNNMKQLGIGMFGYADNNDSYLSRTYGVETSGKRIVFPAMICSPRAPASRPIFCHGAWLIGSSLTTDIYFCPAMTDYMGKGGFWGAKQYEVMLEWAKPEARKFFRTGGREGSVQMKHIAGTTNPYGSCISYSLNLNIYKGSLLVPKMGMVQRLQQLKPEIPVLTDFRGNNCDLNWLQAHNRGMNCLTGSGSVVWFSLSHLADSGSRAYIAGYTKYNMVYWSSFSGLGKIPAPPGYNELEQSLGATPFWKSRQPVDVFSAMWYDLKN